MHTQCKGATNKRQLIVQKKNILSSFTTFNQMHNIEWKSQKLELVVH
jgi:hypothetical protein